MPDRERVLALLRELEISDAEAGAVHDELHGLLEEARVIRAGGLGLQSFRSSWLPTERQRTDGELGRARDEVTAARAALVAAENDVRDAAKDAKRDAELFEVRARDRLSVAERRVVEAENAVQSLENAVRDGEILEETLEVKARVLAAALRGRPRVAAEAGAEPPPGLDGMLAWAETVEAALLVARGQAAAERDAVIRQANELGAVALGEPLTAMGVEALADRVEQGLAGED